MNRGVQVLEKGTFISLEEAYLIVTRQKEPIMAQISRFSPYCVPLTLSSAYATV